MRRIRVDSKETSSIIIWVFDGLQPSQITPELMPNLSSFATQGVEFNNHHAVFPTVTRVNVASMQTGRYPGRHGLAANNLVIREFAPHQTTPALKGPLSQIKESLGQVLFAPTLGDFLGKTGREYVAIGIGSDGNAYLQNPNIMESGGATIHPEFCAPHTLHEELIERFGPWPEKQNPDTMRLAHAVHIMTEYILPERAPAVSMLWCSEPDSTQHLRGVGADGSVRALADADEQFGRLMEWIDQKGQGADTDVIVISDHGYATVKEVVKIETLLPANGFPKGGNHGGVVVATNGGTVLFYADNHNWSVCDRLAAWLMEQPWCGAIMASDALGGIPGTLPASLVGIEGPRGPDLAMSFAWDSLPNEAGFDGHIYSTDKSPGQGQHGSMSKHELRNVLVSKGPSFKGNTVVHTPTGNADLTPTLLRILDIPTDQNFDGRVIHEALIEGPSSGDIDWFAETHRAERDVGVGIYRQEVTVSRVGKASYIDEGKARLEV